MPHDLPKIALIIPCYNEEARLPVSELNDYLVDHPSVKFFLVNDGSDDNTLNLLKSMERENHEQILVHDLPVNQGKAEAVRQGFLTCLDACDREYIGYWDADLATPLVELDRFVAIAAEKDADVVMGSRIRRLGARISRLPHRHYLDRLFATVVSSYLALNIYDTQCGAKLFSSELARRIFAQPFLSRWLFDVELIARTIADGGIEAAEQRILEVPLAVWEDKSGSKLHLNHMLAAPFDLARIFWHYRA
ncbi:glycosyltransferase [Candidatus Hydrogenedentota bacterium]